jgi:acetyl esterase
MRLTTEEHVYRRVDDVALSLYLVRPLDRTPAAPAIIFFHGGRWRSGHPFSFLPYCHYFAARGMTAASASYRLLDRDTSDLRDCIADAQHAIHWLRRLDGVEKPTIVAAGHSAGGHLAACTALLPSRERLDDSRPDALVLLNPVTQVVDPTDNTVIDELSPVSHIAPDAAPTLIVYGTRDFLKPLVVPFGAALQAVGNRCDMAALDGAHNVVHPPARNRDAFIAALRPVDEFLVSLGCLRPAEVAVVVDEMDLFEILAGRSESVDPRKTRPKHTRPAGTGST